MRAHVIGVAVFIALVGTACSDASDTGGPGDTTAAIETATTAASPSTTSTTVPMTTFAPTLTAGAIVGGVATRLDSGCSYQGLTEFDVGREVTFTFVNGTKESNMGFSVSKVPEGITVEEIDKLRRAFYLPDFEEEDRRYSPYLPSGFGRGPGSASELSVVLNRSGLHALICFEFFDDDDVGQDYTASLFTVNE